MRIRERDIDDLLRLIEGVMDDEEAGAMRERLERSASLREAYEQLKASRQWMQSAVEVSAADALRPFFTDRLMRKLRPVPPESVPFEDLVAMMTRVFRPVAIAGFLLAVGLAVYNVDISRDYSVDTTTTEAILALPPVTSMAVFDLDLYAAEAEALP